jgi:diadenosine tetraphosphate (Ap4A) HIT family hydrolase
MATHQANCEICTRIAECREGRHPGLIAELDTGFAVLGDSQQFRGYAILLCKTPATELDELDDATRARYLEEMSQLAAAVRRVVKPHKLNYECLGNLVHHLHFHVFPRQLTDADPKAPVWGQMHKPESAEARATKLDPSRDRELIESIRHELQTIRRQAGERVTLSV